MLANAYPFGSWEPFLEAEVGHWQGFDKIVIFSLSVRQDQMHLQRHVPSGVEVRPIRYRSRAFYAIQAIRTIFDSNLYRELRRLTTARKLTPPRLLALLVFLSRSHHEATIIRKYLDKNMDPQESMLVYAYRFAYQPYIVHLLKRHRDLTAIARAHGSDLYEEHSPSNYLPLRRECASAVDEIHAVSEHGANYLRKQLGGFGHTKVHVSRLGSRDALPAIPPDASEPFRILTCSSIVRVKRLDRLVEALHLMKARPIVWTHFGDGPLRRTLEISANDLGDNVALDFRGEVSNRDFLRILSTDQFHVLANVSESEGIPVSIMEACSAGIPIVATNVGGTSEAVFNGHNGLLIDPHGLPGQIAAALTAIADLHPNDYLAMRTNSRAVWEKSFDGSQNYSRFARRMLTLAQREGAVT